MEERKKILVMDDEPMIGEIACQMLDFLGYEAAWAANGDQAIQEYQRQREEEVAYAAVIVDLTIPGGMGGKETLTGILAIDPAAKVFVSSGYSNDPIMLNFKEYGFTGAIAKPFDIAAMRNMLEDIA